jgi:hypothetical protein
MGAPPPPPSPGPDDLGASAHSAAGALGKLFGPNSTARQLLIWNVAGQLISALLGPAMTEIQSLVNAQFPEVPLSPADLAALVVRGFATHATAAGEAAKSGINSARFGELVNLSGQAPSPEVLVEGLRRGVLAWDHAQSGMPSVLDGIREGNLKNEWAPLMRMLSVQPPSPQEALNALLQGQISRDTAHQRWVEGGGDPTWFNDAFNSEGSAPTPNEAAIMAKRGIIPWTGRGPGVVSYEQAFLEGPWRDKWLAAFHGLSEYLPPPRTVTALLREGAITQAEAIKLLQEQGLSSQLAAAYIHAATQAHASTSKDLSKGEIESLYLQHIITADQAKRMLEALNYTATNAALLLSGIDLRRQITHTNAAVNRVRSMFIAHKITKHGAALSLGHLGIAATAANELLALWEVEAAASVKVLTTAQIASAMHLKIITQAEAEAELVALGYTPWDAWVLLSVHEKEVLPNRPPNSPGPIATV